MPLYEYACQKCGQQLEARQKISDAPLKTCPRCGEDALEKLVSRSSFSLKGSGWYADGYGAKSADASSDSKSTESETKSASSPSSTETKPAASSESKPETKSADTAAKPASPKDGGD